MLKDNSHGDRKNIRLKNHNYNENGFYFFTLCTQNRQCLFSSIVDDTMQVDGAGEMVASTWQEIPCFYAGVVIDQMCIMPNHFHGILELDRSLTVAESEVSLSFPDVIHRFKTLTTKRYSDGVKGLGWPRFDARLWQRNYWERVIRNDKELSEIREYINNNPAKWALDKLYV